MGDSDTGDSEIDFINSKSGERPKPREDKAKSRDLNPRDIDIRNTNLSHGDLMGLDLRAIDFSDKNLVGTKFQYANLHLLPN
jgi:uncharacterized protein YjbI with pentapeptide repeats